jgi:hypothetical protein
MAATEQSKSVAPKRRKRWVLRIVLGLLVVLVGVFLLIPVVASSSPVKSWLQKRIGQSLGGPLSFSDLSMGWWSGIHVKGLSFSDAAGATHVSVEQIAVKPAYGQLLSGRIGGQATVDKPQIALTVSSSPAGKPAVAPAASSGGSSSSLALGQMDLVVQDGQVAVTSPPSQTLRMADINLHVRLEPAGKTSQATIKLTIPQANRTAKVDADLSFQRPADPKASMMGGSAQAKATVQDLDLASLTPVLALAGVGIEAQGMLNVQLDGQVDKGQVKDVTATVNGRDLVVTGPAMKGDRLATQQFNIQAKVTGTAEALEIQDVQGKTDWLSVQAKGRIPMARGQADMAKAVLDGQLNVDVAKVASQLPKTLGMQESLKLQSGRLQGTVKADSGRVDAQASLADVAGLANGKAVSLSQPITAAFRGIVGDKFQIEQLTLNSSFAQVQAKGTTEKIEHTASIDLAKLQSELGRFVDLKGYRFAGRLSCDGAVVMAQDKKDFQGTALIDQLQVTGPNNVTASEPKAQIQYAMGLGAKDLNVRTFQVDSGILALQIKDADVPLAMEQNKPVTFPVMVSKVDLEKARAWLVAMGSLDPNTVLSGTVSSPMQVTFDSTGVTVASDKTRIERLRYGPKGKPVYDPNLVNATFKVKREAATGAVEADCHIQAPAQGDQPMAVPAANVTYKSTAQTTSIQGKVQYSYDLARLTPALASVLPQDMNMVGKRQKVLEFSTQYPTAKSDQLLAHLNAKAGLGFDSAGYMGLDVGTTDPDTVVENGQLKLLPFTSTVNQGQLNFACDVDLTKSPMVFKIPKPMQVAKDVQITPQMTTKLLRYLNPFFADAATASGKVNFACDRLAVPAAGAGLSTLDVEGTISMSDVVIGGSGLLEKLLLVFGTRNQSVRMVIHPTHFVVKDGVVRYDSMQIDVDDHPITFSGSIGPNEKLNMTVTLPVTVGGKTARTGQAGERVAVPLLGTIRKPQLDVEKLIQGQLQQQIQQQVLKGLGGLLNKK